MIKNKYLIFLLLLSSNGIKTPHELSHAKIDRKKITVITHDQQKSYR